MKNILIITYWSYKDALIQTYTLPYIKIIRKHLDTNSRIYLVTFEQSFYKMSPIELEEERKKLRKEGIELLIFFYSKFGFSAPFKWAFDFIKLYFIILNKKISYIHTWCTPAGAIGYVLSVITGKPLILDSYEPHAETMTESNTWGKKSLKFKILFFLEKLQTKRAKTIIATTKGMYEYALKKYDFKINVFYVKPACTNLEIFSEIKIKNKDLLIELGLENKIICVYAGKFGGNYLEKEVFDFLKTAQDYWGDKFRALLLTSHLKNEIEQYANESDVDLSIFTIKYVPHREIATYMGLGDFAITPTKPIPSKRYCTPIKTGEYWALGMPVVSTPNISDDSDIIKEYNIGAVFNDLSHESYLEALKKIDYLITNFSRKELYKKIRPVSEKYRNFLIAERIYAELYS
jgi:hypothetical protein